MEIIANCPGCGKGWLLTERSADCRVRCKYCGLLFKVPQLEDMPEAVDKVQRAKGDIYVDESGNTYG